MSILCDPWFTEGVYDGSWYHYPPIDDPLGLVGGHSHIYISHIHPDHYDVEFLRRYLDRYPDTVILITDFPENYLSRKMTFDGIPHLIQNDFSLGETHLRFFPNGVDSALVVKCRDHSVVNINDNYFQPRLIEDILEFAPTIDLALLPHTGAGPYPQAFLDQGKILATAADAKKQDFFDRYLEYKTALSPKTCLPFAGQYVLAGHLADLNPYRGVSDPVEVLAFDPDAIVLETGASFDLANRKATALRTEAYDEATMTAYIKTLGDIPMDYEVAFAGLDVTKVQWAYLLKKAYENAIKKYPHNGDWWMCVAVPNGWFACYLDKDAPKSILCDEIDDLSPRSEIRIDLRYLFGILTRYYHWNNAEVGSHYETRRYPETFRRDVQNFLNFFHI